MDMGQVQFNYKILLMETRKNRSGERKTDSLEKVKAAPRKKVVMDGEESTYLQNMAHAMRIDSIESVLVSKSGHPTSCSSIAEIMACLLFSKEGAI
jgi:hypothetical protein